MPTYRPNPTPTPLSNILDVPHGRDEFDTDAPLLIRPTTCACTCSASPCPACIHSSLSKQESSPVPDSPATLVGEMDNDHFAKIPDNDGPDIRSSQVLLLSDQVNSHILPPVRDLRTKQRTFSNDSLLSSRPTLYSPTSSTYQISPPTSPTLGTPSSFSLPPSRLLKPSPRSISYSPSPYPDITHSRVRSRGQDCLYPGATFSGTQKSGRTSYDVTVTIVDVNMDTSFLCGYLKIHGLTDDWPELTTYFDAEIIGERYGFLTQDWGASEQEDRTHWGRFPAFRHLKNDMKHPNLTIKDKEREKRGVVFMRWKERFLVPDHRVKDINGASFAGFYYVCVDFNGLAPSNPTHSRTSSYPNAPPSPTSPRFGEDHDYEGQNRAGRGTATMTGFYFHTNSDPYQQLSLNFVPEKTIGSFEFQ